MQSGDVQEEEHDMKDFYWHSPGQEALDRLRREPCIDRMSAVLLGLFWKAEGGGARWGFWSVVIVWLVKTNGSLLFDPNWE